MEEGGGARGACEKTNAGFPGFCLQSRRSYAENSFFKNLTPEEQAQVLLYSPPSSRDSCRYIHSSRVIDTGRRKACPEEGTCSRRKR